MKKTSILFIFLVNFVYGQSVTISPNYLTKNSSSGFNDIEINRFSNVYGVLTGRTASGTDAAPTNTLNGIELFRMGAGGYANGGFTPTRTSISFWTSESWTATANGAKMAFYTTQNGTALQTAKMLIDHNGNTGIGTLTPATRLHVSGAETEKIRLENTIPLGTGINTEMYFKTGTYFTGAIKTTGEGTQTARMGLYTFAGTNSQDLLERLSITDGGNVGIGATNPLEKLHVSGNIRSSNLAGTGLREVYADANGTLTVSNPTQYYSIDVSDFITTTSQYATFYQYFKQLYFTDNASHTIMAPIHLPHGSVISNVTVYYEDNSAQTLQFNLGRTPITSAGGIALTNLGSSTNASTSLSLNLNYSIDNSLNSYSLIADGVWDTINLKIVGVRITYTL